MVVRVYIYIWYSSFLCAYALFDHFVSILVMNEDMVGDVKHQFIIAATIRIYGFIKKSY